MKIKEILPRVYDDRQLRALTGLKTENFILFLSIFEKFLIDEKKEKEKDKYRKYGSGLKSALDTPAEKLLFILNYMKCYSTFDCFGFNFNMTRSSAHTHVYKLFPFLIKTLDYFNALPETSLSTPEEMQQAFGNVETLLIDATERAIQRPIDYEKQKENYSGKKKQHTNKNTIIATLGYLILYTGLTSKGKNHDYGMFKQEFDPELNWFSNFKVFVDLGYLGFNNEYKTKELNIPHKKPNKSKINPNPELTKKQKDENKEMSRQRVIVEHVIGGMKRYKCLVDKFRNKKDGWKILSRESNR